ncbi:MAG TPA: pilus assembly protein N-terminal domain-containing protein [Albitalea sp.]|uniref:type II and III secretion system protein family protein n=1 Tax=Piscinibacter sp. TaxID=1903157 RepID=UPI002ED4986E
MPRQPQVAKRRRALDHAMLALLVGTGASAAPPAWAQSPGAHKVAAATAATVRPVTRETRAPSEPFVGSCSSVNIAPAVQVSVGKSTVVKPASPVARVLLGNPDGSRAGRPAEATTKDAGIAPAPMSAENKSRPGVAEVDVVLLSPTEVYLLGKSIGTTNVVLLDRNGQCTAFDVVIGMDIAALQAVIGQILPDEKGVRVTSAFDSVVLSGGVTDATAVSTVMDLANAYVRGAGGGAGASVAGANPRIVNLLSVGAPQQVMLEVKVAEISRSLLDKFGINFSRAYAAGDGSFLRFISGIFGGTGAVAGQIVGTVGAQAGGGIVGSTTNGQTTSGITGPFGSGTTDGSTIPQIGGKNTTQLGIDAQKTDGLVKVLAEPNVLAISGKEGRFNAGGKIFIPVAQSNNGGGTTIVLEEKEFGVSVRFRPTVMDAGRINLELLTEVSELNREGVGISAPGVNGLAVLPSFTSRKASTTVQLMDGQSFAIGGLIKNNTTTNIKAFPFLGEMPILGPLFRSTQFQTDKSELVFVVTPRLVKPLPPNYTLPTDTYVPPTRKDLVWDGRLEGQAPPPPPAPSGSPAPASGFQVK